MLTRRIPPLVGLIVVLALSVRPVGHREATATERDVTLDDARTLARFGEFAAAYRHAFSSPSTEKRSQERLELELRLLTQLRRYRAADTLLAANVPLGDPNRLYTHHLRRGILNLLAENPAEAREYLVLTEQTPNARFDAHRDFLLMQALRTLGEAERALAVGNRALEGDLPQTLFPEFHEEFIETLVETGNEQRALSLARALTRRAKRSSDKSRMLGRQFDLEMNGGDLEAARQTALTLARRHPGEPSTAGVVTRLLSEVRASDLSVNEIIVYTGFRTRHESPRAARALADQLRKSSPRGTDRERRDIALAEYHYARGNYREVIRLVMPRFRVASLKRQSVLLLARSYRRTGQRPKAARVYEYFARTFPNDGKAAEALFVAYRIHQDVGNEKAVERVLSRLGKSYPSNYFGRSAAMATARKYAQAGDHERSAEVLNRVLRRSRGTNEAALFYLAQTYGKSGRDDAADALLSKLATLDKYSYYLHPMVNDSFTRPLTNSTGTVALSGDYGLLSFLREANRARTSATTAIGDVLGAAERTSSLQDDDYFVRGTWLLDCGFQEWGERELGVAARRHRRSSHALLELAAVYEANAMPWESVRLYQRVFDGMRWSKRRGVREHFLRLLYPTPYPLTVLNNSAQYNVEPHLISAIVREESRFDAQAVSRAGAIGLMQLMPVTAEYVAGELDLPEWGVDWLLEPEINLTLGIWYASSLLRVADGDALRMLAAYNAGPGNARRWFDRPGNVTPVQLVDDIDFRETRNYVHRVVESSHVYHDLYFSAGDASSGGGQ